ncbi:UPF0271 protein [Pseudoclavibacter endophyticus]|uniref:LamB/YcsF family protein n=1 Tax=Pseudoclavibacter endophyticus TaxID=1778590 RepID=A0A6H9WHN5_9MICO|nr:5-oxoprolinase subunit PxpA [Pseudoclavibacter endophyticus]KAB1647907.1 LamB/YcsF family protein [Pseudoclavibacter endophyticus]GGA73821.1 UPF0271 protein [Pseudoclavibacter endophyticus]
MGTLRIDLNCDAGEHFGRWTLGDDAAMFASVSSANIATGFHAGDPAGMVDTCRAAVDAGVAIGAHVGYRDLAGFGRRFIEVAPRDLRAETIYQLGALASIARSVGGAVRYVKPHGALYHAVATNRGQAEALVDGIATSGTGSDAGGAPLILLVAPGSLAGELARERGISVAHEVFADRGYLPTGGLVPRGDPDALVTDPAIVARRAVRFAVERVVEAVDGSIVEVAGDSLSLHGDTAGAPRLARAIRDALVAAGVEIAPFASPAPRGAARPGTA